MMKYADIITLPRHVSGTHAPMPIRNRAAQFSAFAALSGYEDVIGETARLTESRIVLSESECGELDRKLNFLRENAHDNPAASITCFVPDKTKPGGEYRTVSGRVKRVDEFSRTVIFTGGESVPIDSIISAECERFSDGEG